MKSNKNIFIVFILMAVGVLARLIPHVPNFTPTESIAIFGAAYLGYRYLALLLPLVLIYVSDFFINNTIARSFFPETEGLVFFNEYMLYTASAIILIVMLSKWSLKNVNTKNVIFTVFASTILYYLVTNFSSWAITNSIYPSNMSGLIMAYVAGLPFLKVSILGNLLFSGFMFGGKAIIERIIESRQVTA